MAHPANPSTGSGFPTGSLEVVQGKAEPSLASAPPDDRYQFERLGYFCMDKSSQAGLLVFNRTAELRDTWASSRRNCRLSWQVPSNARQSLRMQDLRKLDPPSAVLLAC